MFSNKANTRIKPQSVEDSLKTNQYDNNYPEIIILIKEKINRELNGFAINYEYHSACKEFVTEVHNILLSPEAKRVRGIIPVFIADTLKMDIDECLLHGLAIELLHFTSLIHDDVIDEDNHRRGYPTLNNTFANNQAVLIGDYMMCEVINYGLKSAHSFETIGLMVKAVQNLVAGLIMEQNVLPFEKSFSNYQEMAYLKTGSLFGLSFGLPFIGDKRFQAATSCGQVFGLLFQIYDDYLDKNSDHGYENIFSILPKAEINKIWKENYAKLLKGGREIGIGTVVTGIEQYLRANGYFMDILKD